MVTFYWWLAGALIAAVLTIPSWACLFRRHPVEWADERAEAEEAAAAEAESRAEASGGGGGGSGKHSKKSR